MTTRARPVVYLWAAIAATLVGLVGLVGFVHAASERIGAMDSWIVDDTAPSVVAVETASVELGKLVGLLRDHLRAPGERAGRAGRIAERRAAMHAGVTWYLGLPVDPGEAPILDEMRARVARFDGVADRVLATTSAAPPEARDELRDELDAAASDLDTTLLRAANLNADLVTDATKEIRSAQQRLLPGVLAIEALSVVAAGSAILTANRLRRTAEEAVRARQGILEQKNTELEAFSARVAHDLLSPLNTVSMAVGMAERRLSSPGGEEREDARLCALLTRAMSTLQRVRQMVTDLLDFALAAASPPSGIRTEVEPVLRGLVEDLEPVADEAGVHLRLSNVSRRRVGCTAGILESVLSNLVQNAIKHAGVTATRGVDVRALDADGEVRFEVEDTGPGIRPEDREAIFEPYVRRSDLGPGLGLGLATVKRLAESHGGHVGVRSELGHGALFWVTLPAAP